MSFIDILNRPLPSKTRIYHVPDMEYYEENTYDHEKMNQKKLKGADIGVYGDEGKYPHFHLSWGNRRKPTKTCCIRFDKNFYFLHPGHERTDITLKSEEIEELIKILNSKHKATGIPEKYQTVWELMIYWWNLLGEYNSEMIELPDNLPIPDYTKIERANTKEEKEVNHKLLSKCFARLNKNEK